MSDLFDSLPTAQAPVVRAPVAPRPASELGVRLVVVPGRALPYEVHVYRAHYAGSMTFSREEIDQLATKLDILRTLEGRP
jgi:hypothetical protein